MVVAPRLFANIAVLIVLSPELSTNGVTALPVLDVVTGVVTWEGAEGWAVLGPAELIKAELLTAVSCPGTAAAAGAQDKELELSSVLPEALLAAAIELEELLLNKPKAGLEKLWSRRQKLRNTQKSPRTSKQSKPFFPTLQCKNSFKNRIVFIYTDSSGGRLLP